MSSTKKNQLNKFDYYVKSEEFKDICSKVRNLPELKLKIMDSDILAYNYTIYELLKYDDELLSTYLRDQGVRFKVDKQGALIKHKQIQMPNLSYRIISPGEKWVEAGEWIRFFKLLGNFLHQNKQFDLFVNYLDENIPAILVSLGIIEDYFKQLANENLFDTEYLQELFTKGDTINFLDNDGKWYKVEVIEVKNHTHSTSEKFNPYLVINGTFAKGQKLTRSIPNYQWIKNIRISDAVKQSPGRSKVVYLEDRISDVISIRYTEMLSNWLKMNSEVKINLIGWGIDKQIRKVMDNIQFSDEKGSYLASDFLYLDSDLKTNYVNVHMVTGNKSEINTDENSISVFIGAKNALRFSKHRTLRNIYLTNRIRKEYYDDVDLLVNNLNQFSQKSNNERIEFLNRLHSYLFSQDLSVPKGVEIYAF